LGRRRESQQRRAIVAFCREITATCSAGSTFKTFGRFRLEVCFKLGDNKGQLFPLPVNLPLFLFVVHRKFVLGCNPKQTHFPALPDASCLNDCVMLASGRASLRFAPLSNE
jgi:hypothetical protein